MPAPLRQAIQALGLYQNWALWSTPLDNRYYVLAAQLCDVIAAHEPKTSRAAQRARAKDLLKLVGINADRLSSYPH